MAYEAKEAELTAFGCKSPEWFLRDHIPRYAQYFEMTFEKG